jgi:hypothetical protein
VKIAAIVSVVLVGLGEGPWRTPWSGHVSRTKACLVGSIASFFLFFRFVQVPGGPPLLLGASCHVTYAIPLPPGAGMEYEN